MIAGIDISTRAVDIVALDEDQPARCEHLRVPLDGRWWESARYIRRTLAGHGVAVWLLDRGVHLAGIERPYGRPRQAIAALHTVLGALLASLPAPVFAMQVTPQDMRRELGLPANCPKEALQKAVRAAIWTPDPASPRAPAPWMDWPLDAYDAWAAGHAALRLCERGQTAA